MKRGEATRYSIAGISVFVLISALVLATGISLSNAPTASAAITSDNRRVLLWNDTHVGNSEGDGYANDYENAVNAIIDLNPDLGFAIGDVTSAGSDNAWEIFQDNNRYIVNNTDMERMYYSFGHHHDAFQGDNGAGLNTIFSIPQGWNYAPEVMMDDNRTAYHFAVTDGNIAYIMLSNMQGFDDSGNQIFESSISPHVLDWFENRLAYFENENYNVIVMSHAPLVHTNIGSGGGFPMDDKRWRDVSDDIIEAMNRHPPDMFVSAHKHVDSDCFNSGESGVAGATVVWGENYNAEKSRTPSLPDDTVFVSSPDVCHEHTGLSDNPSVNWLDLQDGENYLELYSENPENRNLEGWTENVTDTVHDSPIRIDLEHPIDLDSDGIDNFYQPWCVSNYSDTAWPEGWWNVDGLVQDDNEWIVSRWRFNEPKSFNSLRVDYNHEGYIDHTFWSGDSLSSWSGPYRDPSNAPAGKYWKVKTNLHPSSSLQIYDMSLNPQQIVKASPQYYENMWYGSVSLVGDLKDMGSASSADVWFQYRRKGASTWENTPKQALSSLKDFSVTISGLEEGTTYEWRVVADNGTVENAGTIKEFTTRPGTGKVASSPDWYDSSAAEEKDVRMTVDNTGKLRLLGENLLGYWSMDSFPSGFGSTDNTVYDLTSYVNDGTAEGGITSDNITAGKFDNALEFDGDDDLIDTNIDNFFDISAPMTVGGWAYVGESHNVAGGADWDMFGKYDGDGWIFRWNDDSLELWFGNPHSSATYIPDKQTWTHWAATWDGNEIRYYINGDLFDTVSTTDSIVDGASSLRMMQIGSGLSGHCAAGRLDEPFIENRVLSEDEIKKIYNRTKPLSLTGQDLENGTWTSQTYSLENSPRQIENIEYSVSIGTGENVLWCVENSTDNTGWFQDPNPDNTIKQTELPENITGDNYFGLCIKLETDNTVHSPAVKSWELNTKRIPTSPTVETISANLALVDKTDSTPLFDENDSVEITSKVKDRNGRYNLRHLNVRIRDNADSRVFNENVVENIPVNVRESKFRTSYNPSVDVETGPFDVYAKGVDIDDLSGVENYEGLGESLFVVTDLNTTLSISDTTPARGDKITISGTASRVYGTISLDNVVVEVNGELHQADFDENGSWSYRHTVRAPKGSEVDVRVHLLDRGSSIDGISSTWTFKVQEVPGGAPIVPTKPEPISIDVEVGRLEEGTFKATGKLGLGEVATVRIELTSNGEPVEGADVGAWWIPRPTTGKTETIGISEVGNGIYQGSFTIPDDIALGAYKVSAEATKSGYEKTYGYDTFEVVSKVAKPGPLDRAIGWARENPATVAVLIAAILLFALIARW